MKKKSFFNCKGKYHRYLYFIVFGIVLGSFFGAIIKNTVYALPNNWVKIDDFDDYAINNSSGVSTFGSWERISGDDGIIRGTFGGNLYVLSGIDGTHSGYNLNPNHEIIYFNSSENHTGFYFDTIIYNYIPSGWYNCYYYFKNSTGANIVMFRVRGGNALGTQIHYFNGDNWVQLYSVASRPRIIISWNHYTLNIIQYRVMDSSYNDLIIPVNSTCNIDSHNKSDYNLSTCYFYTTDSTTGSGDCKTIFYEYGYINVDLEGQETCEGLDGIVFTTYKLGQNGTILDSFTGIPNELFINTVYKFKITTIGDIGAEVQIILYNPNNDIDIYYQYIQDETIKEYEIIRFWTSNTKNIGQWTFSYQDYFNNPCGAGLSGNVYFNVSSFNYTQFYGKFLENYTVFVEWFYPTQQYIFVNDPINFAYFLSHNESMILYTDEFYYAIVMFKDNVPIKILYPSSDTFGELEIISNYGTFEKEGIYQLKIYNMSNLENKYGSPYNQGEIEYISTNLIVYTDIDNDGIPDSMEDIYNPPSGETDLTMVYNTLKILGMFFFLLILGSVIAVKVDEWAIVPFVLFGGLGVFSVPNTFICLLPPVFLFVSALVLILLIIYIFYK